MNNISLQHGDLLQAPVEALVNTVNCVGVMGKGIALQFDWAFPDNSRLYKESCKRGELHPGDLLVYKRQPELEKPLPLIIFNFATKDHWRGRSRLEWIESGLQHLVAEVNAQGLNSIAIPPLGCGNGGLKWSVVRPLIETAFSALPDVKVWLYAPEGAPEASQMATPQKAPTMNATAALYIRLLAHYSAVDLEFSHLVFQKLAYFLKEAGEPSRWKFKAQIYGPAADGPFQYLRQWEHHWIIGFGDGTGGPQRPMLLKPEVIAEAEEFLIQHPVPEREDRVNQVIHLIEGLDTATGLELLASVHWVAREHPEAASDYRIATDYVHRWNEHKRRNFPVEWIHAAWQQLHERGWMEKLQPIERTA
ncbi:hypothetical protein IAD21_03510 [Abditibacteriota bacterium]|nr:hypothetical protein IAD21_03510 [Abditibacteriota bacterium]